MLSVAAVHALLLLDSLWVSAAVAGPSLAVTFWGMLVMYATWHRLAAKATVTRHLTALLSRVMLLPAVVVTFAPAVPAFTGPRLLFAALLVAHVTVVRRRQHDRAGTLATA
jgi:hypothetical protein